MYPSFFWSLAEPSDEIGLREVRHINGLYLFLDELARRHPGLILDNCASGGRRLDFEMMRRCVALWRSDSCWGDPTFPRNVQAMTHGLSHWLPLHGLGAAAADHIALRSGMGACASYAINFHDPGAVEALRQHLARYLRVRPLFAKDYYPLTSWSDDPARLLAFQFHDRATGKGLVQAFRAPKTRTADLHLRLQGLTPTARYTLLDWDGVLDPLTLRGSELMEKGLALDSEHLPVALVIEYSPAHVNAGHIRSRGDRR